MFLTTSGTLLACGSNQFNKLGLNDRVSLRMQLKKLLGNVVVSVHVKQNMALSMPCWAHGLPHILFSFRLPICYEIT